VGISLEEIRRRRKEDDSKQIINLKKQERLNLNKQLVKLRSENKSKLIHKRLQERV
jgi:hypothetical protein